MEIPPAGQVRPGVGTLVIKCLSGHRDKVTQWTSALHLPTKFYKVLGHPLSYEPQLIKHLILPFLVMGAAILLYEDTPKPTRENHLSTILQYYTPWCSLEDRSPHVPINTGPPVCGEEPS